MTSAALSPPAVGEPAAEPPVALVGEPHARLLAGPPRHLGAEGFESHLERIGPLPLPEDREARRGVRDLLAAAGLRGRGGGEFPLHRKLEAAHGAGGTPIVVATGSEGEPASRKDRTLLELRPHLVLDGVELVAAAVGAPRAVVLIEPGRASAWRAVSRALAERDAARRHRRRDLGAPEVQVVAAPSRYVAGESSAVVEVLESGLALPRRRRVPVAVEGVLGRPTVVSNVETLAHVALVARFGAPWFSSAGSDEVPGSTLVTLGGGAARPGLVAELLRPVPGHRLLSGLAGLAEAPAAVLVGGYGGRWIGGEAFSRTLVGRGMPGPGGRLLSLGCGLVAPLPAEACGLATTHRLLEWLAGESAGQCGPCAFGLPELARRLGDVVAGRRSLGRLRRLSATAVSIKGRGACGHPDGAVALLESALEVFDEDLRRHLAGRPCGRGADAGWFPLGSPPEEIP
ncbi:MAG TPA: NADH-ubiquinone oxidoreductase-F iron-sulfur binding region domain-containing protein [Acidimicrobiales bacterium]|nr:NADH-ubiquinone oxidoreductase-F iron-sulfur binding region domain-containing protein [Acidimicrobiales bacterium]